MNAGLAIPALIILGCGLLAGAVAFATRKKRAPWDIFPGPIPEAKPEYRSNGPDRSNGRAESSTPEGDPNGGHPPDDGKPGFEPVEDTVGATPSGIGASSGAGAPSGAGASSGIGAPSGAGAPSGIGAPSGADTNRADHENLAGWHRLHELTVSAWIDNHQKVLGNINASGLQIDLENRDELMAGHEELAPRMREAIADHPSPVMRAELSAMHVAGEATIFAMLRSDYETARRQHLVYVQYRDEWIERLRQFSDDPTGSLRAVLTTTEFELEEIRSALEAALVETENPAEEEYRREAPLVAGEDPTPILDLDDQPEEVLQAAVGSPEDTTDDLDGSRLHHLLRRKRKKGTE